VSIDELGRVQAYDLKTGGPVWSAGLSDAPREACALDGAPPALRVRTADDELHDLDLATGKKPQAAKGKIACRTVSASGAPMLGYRRITTHDFNRHRLPSSVSGMSVDHALVPEDGGTAFLLGSRAKGSSVPMVAAVKGGKVIWKELVPGVDPLTTSVEGPIAAAAAASGRVVVPYPMRDRSAGVRMACLDEASGRRVWDIEVHRGNQVEKGIVVADDAVYYASWSMLYAFDLIDGTLRFKVGTDQ
jgi:outer membrane protein assembly factor BamB